jgi:hypothetical protein
MRDTRYVLVVRRDQFARQCTPETHDRCTLVTNGTHVHIVCAINTETRYDHYRITNVYDVP